VVCTGLTAINLSSSASAGTAAGSSSAWSRESKPAPLVLSPGTTMSEETKSAPVVSSSTGGHEDTSVPSTPLSDPVASKQATPFEVTLTPLHLCGS